MEISEVRVTQVAFEAALGRMDPEQLEALSVCIMAERRLRHMYPRDPAGSAIAEAYEWAMKAKPAPIPSAAA